MPEPEDQQQERVNAFTFAVEQMRDGALLQELDGKLRELASAVVVHDRGGKLTLTLEVKPPAKRAGTAIVITTKANLSLPQEDPSSRILFVSMEDASLSLDNPDQMHMFRPNKERSDAH